MKLSLTLRHEHRLTQEPRRRRARAVVPAIPACHGEVWDAWLTCSRELRELLELC